MLHIEENHWLQARPTGWGWLTRVLVVATLALVHWGCADSDPTTRTMKTSETSEHRGESVHSGESPTFFLGGIQVHEASHEGWFDALKAQSMNTVQVTDYAKQGDWDTDHMWWDEEAPWVLEEIRGAKQRGLAVAFVCRVALDHSHARNEFLWHGMIRPKTDEQLASWFEQYTRFVVKWAETAEREGVDVFMIGSELNVLATTLPATEPPGLEEYFLNAEKQAARRAQVLAQETLIAQRHLETPEREGFASVDDYIDARIATEKAWAETVTGGNVESLTTINRKRALLGDHWSALIAKVRAVYSGKIGYAANFDQYHEVGFWSELDVMGINAYFSLRDRVLPDETEDLLYPMLVDGWSKVLGDVAEFREMQQLTDKPVIFTEMGYTYRAKSTLRPWAHEGFSLVHNPRTSPDGTPGEPEEYVVVWGEEPIRLEERAWAVRALWQAHGELEQPFLAGILYWKLSSHDYHVDEEAFMVHIGEGTEDPVLPELRRFLAQ